MSKFKISIEYLGKNYSGWQIQQGKDTIEQRLCDAIYSVTGENVKISGSGRTDAGVSAINQVASFSINKDITPQKLVKALNAHLPQDISVKDAIIVADSFDARFSAKTKTYNYYFYVSSVREPLKDRFALQVLSCDVQQVKQACKYLIGTFDFKSFVARNSGKTNFIRTIYNADVNLVKDNLYCFSICGNGFLYNMVRIIMGTLLEVGKAKILPSDVAKIIEQKDRTKAGKTVPAIGLVLQSVEYNN